MLYLLDKYVTYFDDLLVPGESLSKFSTIIFLYVCF